MEQQFYEEPPRQEVPATSATQEVVAEQPAEQVAETLSQEAQAQQALAEASQPHPGPEQSQGGQLAASNQLQQEQPPAQEDLALAQLDAARANPTDPELEQASAARWGRNE